MIGTIRWNVVLGAVGFGLTFLLSVQNNFLGHTLLQSAYCFLIGFAVAFVFRWIIGTWVNVNPVHNSQTAADAEATKQLRGTAVDAVTPSDEEELHDLLKEQLNNSRPDDAFAPLQPQKLASVPGADTEQMVQALRRLSEK